MFGDFLYRLRGDAPTRNPDRLAQLKDAAKVLGMDRPGIGPQEHTV